jgi:ElaB/YqjD/DUF883 family membrane-anchored ribosome-binding protein
MNTSLPTHRDGLQGSEAGLATNLDDLGRQATEFAIDGARSLREQAQRARDSAAGYVQHQPLTAVLLAAAGGAAVMLLASWLMHASASRR